VGAWLAFADAGIVPTDLFGCSAGAIVSAMQATGRSVSECELIVRGLRTRDVVRKLRFWKLRAFWLTHFCDPAPIEALVNELLPESFNALQIPLTVSATSMGPRSAYRNLFFMGPKLRQAVRASMAIAGAWPYVDINGNPHSDGGTTDAIVLPRNLDKYDAFYIVNLTRDRQQYRNRDKNIISRLVWNVEQLAAYERIQTLEECSARPNVHWISIDLGDSSMLAFDHDLILTARIQASQQLKEISRATEK